VRRKLIQAVLPLAFCLLPPLAGVLIFLALPATARKFYLERWTAMDGLILLLGGALFVAQMFLAWQAMRWRGGGFDERPDPWLTHLAQAAEWFPLLGLLGTVAAILQTFNSMSQLGEVSVEARMNQIITLYGPAITATGSGLFMALINILPTWLVLVGRDLIRTLGGDAPAPPEVAAAAETAGDGLRDKVTRP
jgi:hypothetical protein